MAVEVLLKDVGYLMEGPHWDDVTNTLLFIDITGKTIYRYYPETQITDKVVLEDTVGSVVPTLSGRLLAASGHRLGFVDWKTGQMEVINEVEKDKATKFNDGKCDAKGRFWIGTADLEAAINKGQGALYCLYPDRQLFTNVENVACSNGLAWTADNKTMYYIDSLNCGVDAFDFNINSGKIENRRQVIPIPTSEGLGDGMCIDNEGMIWVAIFGGAAVHRYNPTTGEKLQTVKLPTNSITSCCWGGANRDELYVTSAKHYLSEEQLKEQETAGSIFRVTGLGVTGVKCEPFDDSKF